MREQLAGETWYSNIMTHQLRSNDLTTCVQLSHDEGHFYLLETLKLYEYTRQLASLNVNKIAIVTHIILNYEMSCWGLIRPDDYRNQ